jgi:hypothetical protein
MNMNICARTPSIKLDIGSSTHIMMVKVEKKVAYSHINNFGKGFTPYRNTKSGYMHTCHSLKPRLLAQEGFEVCSLKRVKLYCTEIFQTVK